MGTVNYEKSVNIPSNGRLRQLLESGKDITLMFLGGSVTAGYEGGRFIEDAYPALVCRHLSEKYPDRKIKCVDLSDIGYMSSIGLTLYADNCERYSPDIVFGEFAVNDRFDVYNAENYECLIRRVIKSRQSPVFISVNCCRSDGTGSEAFMRELADYYSCPSVSIKAALDVITPENYSSDGLHPHEEGHRLIAKLVCHVLDHPSKGDMPLIPDVPVYGSALENTNFADGKAIEEKFGCEITHIPVSKHFPDGIRISSQKPLSFVLPAEKNQGILNILIQINSDPRLYGRADVTVNREVYAVLEGYSIYSLGVPVSFAVKFEPNIKCEISIVMHKGDENKSFDIAGLCL